FHSAVVYLLLAPVGGSLDEGDHQGMWIIWLGGTLRLEQSCDVETVCGRFDSANYSVGTTSHHGESGFHRRPFVFRIDFKVAEELFGNDILSVERVQIRARSQTNFRNRAG